MVTILESIIIVNPQLLLKEVRAAVRRNCEKMDAAATTTLSGCLKRYFEAEVKAAKG